MKSLPKTEEAKLVGVWIRVSTEDQAKGESPDHHERRARHYAEAKGWTVLEVYHLEGVSGKAVSEHPETKRMLADIRSGHISALIFSKLARLARNTKELLEFADMFRECESDLVSLQESIDTSTPGRSPLLHNDRRNGAVGARRDYGTHRRFGADPRKTWKAAREARSSATSGKIGSS